MKGELEKGNITKTIADDIPVEIKNAFREMLKRGIYIELHQRNLLSDAQLNSLLHNK